MHQMFCWNICKGQQLCGLSLWNDFFSRVIQEDLSLLLGLPTIVKNAQQEPMKLIGTLVKLVLKGLLLIQGPMNASPAQLEVSQ